MTLTPLSLVVLCPLLLLSGCETHGVSIGTEELCVKDARLVAAEERPGSELVSNCAEIGDNQLQNAGFEAPNIGSCGEPGLFCQFPAADVMGWTTTSAEQVIEIWLDGHMAVPAPDGMQFGELDARSRDTLQQDVALTSGQLMYWSLQHRGRNGIDSMEVLIGPPDAVEIQARLSTAEDAWRTYSGLYRVGADQTDTRFALVSRSGEEQGNLVDSAVFAPVTDR